MKILLVYPYFIDQRINEEDVSAVPMGLYAVGAMLVDHGYAVNLLNAYDMGRTPRRIELILREQRPDVLGFSILNANRWGGIDMARVAKRINPQTVVVFGGVGATFLWRHFLAHFPAVDYVVRGEGEHSFLELVRFLESRTKSVPTDIPGLAFRKNGRPCKTPDREPVSDLDSLPKPAEHFRFQHVSLTRGCPADCSFCGSPAIWKRRVRFHSCAYFIDQISRLHAKGIRFFYVSDDTFTLKRKRVIEICRSLVDKALPISWAAISRVDCVDEEVLHWMRRAGCTQISYGVESGSRDIRKLFHKQLREADICRAFDLTVHYGIMARAYFIYGAPGESDETIEASLALIRRIRPLSAIFYVLDLFPGTALYEAYKARTGVTDDIWLQRVEDICYFETDASLNKKTVLAFGKRLRKGFYAGLADFATQVALKDDPALYPLHADFLSRLALTFSHGDYANNPWVKRRRRTAVTLFERSLGYHPDHRAFWGLGLVHQQMRRFDASNRIVRQGIHHYPDSADLHLVLAHNLMQTGRYAEARRYLEAFPDNPQAIAALVRCCRAAGDRAGFTTWSQRMRRGGR